MNVNHGSANHGSIEDDVRRAIEQGRHIQAKVRDITLAALARGELESAEIRKVTAEVMKSVKEAARVQGASAKEVAAEAAAGVSQALAHAAQALKLSIEEAAGRAEQFSREDLAKARATLKAVLEDLAEHARASGPAVGRQLEEMSALTGRAAQAGRAHFDAGVRAALSSGAMMARVASGVLAGIADSLAEKGKDRPR